MADGKAKVILRRAKTEESKDHIQVGLEPNALPAAVDDVKGGRDLTRYSDKC